MSQSKISVGGTKASIDITNADGLLNQVVRESTKELRRPMEQAMRDIYNGVKRTWPRPTKANRGGNRRAREAGFNPPGWASTGFSQKRFYWKTFVDPRQDTLSITVALLNPAQNHHRKGRYLYMARYPYPSRKFYWRELIDKPMKKESKRLIPKLAAAQLRSMGG
tara:strand:- start:53 stop:547 length:495 start_codon:yes stop_codon:yes gene_type:complete